MSTAICPYCRGAIEPDEPQSVLCPGCGTPHHGDCFEENGGCTVFGCTAAPAPEPKLSIGAPDLQASAITASAPSPAAPPPPPFPGSFSAPPPPLVTAAPQAAESGIAPPMFSSLGYDLLAHPLPAGEPEARPLFSSLGYGSPRSTPYPAPTPQPMRMPDPTAPARSRAAYMLLGVFLGAFGAHSFYAGSTKKGLIQLAITLLTFGLGGMMVWVWAVIDICTISTDSNGIPFRN